MLCAYVKHTRGGALLLRQRRCCHDYFRAAIVYATSFCRLILPIDTFAIAADDASQDAIALLCRAWRYAPPP